MKMIPEARRNPDVNIKDNYGHQSALTLLETIPKADLKNYGVTMTQEPKVGINPKSGHHSTPIGIYFYPAAYYLKIIKSRQDLPYVHDAPYINVLKLSGTIIRLSRMTPTTYTTLNKRLSDFADKLGLQYNEQSDIKLLGERLYDSINQLARSPKHRVMNRKTKAPRVPVMLNYILRNIGIDVLIDEQGHGIIHENEPSQGVAIDPTAIEVIARYENKNQEKLDSRVIATLRAMFSTTSLPSFIDIAVSDFTSVDVKSIQNNPEIQTKIAKRLLKLVQQDSQQLLQPGCAELAFLLSDKNWLLAYAHQGVNYKELTTSKHQIGKIASSVLSAHITNPDDDSDPVNELIDALSRVGYYCKPFRI